MGLRRFEWVTDHLQNGDRLARSSAPNYDKHDSDHRLTPEAIEFLKKQGITHVISLNHEAHAEHIKTALANGGIAYTPLPVPDFGPPTLQDFKKGWEAFVKHRTGTLVWCGYGHGRTGTMISALQTYAEKEKPSPQALTRDDYSKNHVETEPQKQVLQELQRVLHKRPAPADDAEAGPSTKKPNVAVSEGLLFGAGVSKSWETLESLLDIESSLPAGLISDVEMSDLLGTWVADFEPIASPLAVAADEVPLTFAADEAAMWASLNAYFDTIEAAPPAAEGGAALVLSPEEIESALEEVMVEYPPLEAGALGASAIGDADLVAFLDSLPAVTEAEILALNVEETAGAAALGDADLIAQIESLPVEDGELVEVAAEVAEGTSFLEGLIEAALEFL